MPCISLVPLPYLFVDDRTSVSDIQTVAQLARILWGRGSEQNTGMPVFWQMRKFTDGPLAESRSSSPHKALHSPGTCMSTQVGGSPPNPSQACVELPSRPRHDLAVRARGDDKGALKKNCKRWCKFFFNAPFHDS